MRKYWISVGVFLLNFMLNMYFRYYSTIQFVILFFIFALLFLISKYLIEEKKISFNVNGKVDCFQYAALKIKLFLKHTKQQTYTILYKQNKVFYCVFFRTYQQHNYICEFLSFFMQLRMLKGIILNYHERKLGLIFVFIFFLIIFENKLDKISSLRNISGNAKNELSKNTYIF